MRVRRAAGAGASLALLLAGCAAPSASDHPGTVQVVASTNVYGDVAAQVAGTLAGTKVRITSIIDDPGTDPHSYEGNARTLLAVAQANLIIENGGGYDDFATRMRRAAGARATVLDAVQLSGKADTGTGFNEHVWYDVPTVARLAEHIRAALTAEDAADAKAYAANARVFLGKLRALEATEARIRAAHRGEKAAITEPVPLYLLQACGLQNVTPVEFSEAVEAGTDVPADVLDTTLRLFTHHDVDVLVYNAQTSGVETERVLAAARHNGVPVVPVTETMPRGDSYLSWMRANLAALESALTPR